jgi:hypothetical protein
MASEQGLPVQKVRDEKAAREAAIRKVVREFDSHSVDEAPFRPEEFVILSMLERSAYDKYVGVYGKRPSNLWWVSLSEGTHDLYVQRWDPVALGPPGRGVSVRGNRMLVFTGEKHGLDYGKIDVTGHPGPWNAQAREMAGELKGYAGSDDKIVSEVLEADTSEWMRFRTSSLSKIFKDPEARAVPSRASAADLERAKEIVEGRQPNPSDGSRPRAPGGQSNQSSGLARVPPWVWVVIALGALFLLLRGQ